jgi:hypothetical protein
LDLLQAPALCCCILTIPRRIVGSHLQAHLAWDKRDLELTSPFTPRYLANSLPTGAVAKW